MAYNWLQLAPLQAEHGIKSLSNTLMKHLSGLGDNWHSYTRPAMLTYNTYNTPNLDNLGQFELAFERKPILVPKLESAPPPCSCDRNICKGKTKS